MEGDSTDTKPEISVVIPARNAAKTLGAQLDALAAQETSRAFEVVVADNGSTDETDGLVRGRTGPLLDLRLVDASDGAGAAHARNAGARNARSPKLLFCDSDDVVGHNWISEMSAALEQFDIVGGYLDVEFLNDATEIAWRGHMPADRLPSDRFLPAGSSANLGIRREVFDALDGFDTTISPRAAGEDLDLFWRAGLAGYSVGFVPDAVVHYRLRTGLRANLRQEFTYARSLARLWKRYRGRGMTRPAPSIAAKRIAWLLVHLPDLVRGERRRGRWLRSSASIAGAVVGSFENRVVYV